MPLLTVHCRCYPQRYPSGITRGLSETSRIFHVTACTTRGATNGTTTIRKPCLSSSSSRRRPREWDVFGRGGVNHEIAHLLSSPSLPMKRCKDYYNSNVMLGSPVIRVANNNNNRWPTATAMVKQNYYGPIPLIMRCSSGMSNFSTSSTAIATTTSSSPSPSMVTRRSLSSSSESNAVAMHSNTQPTFGPSRHATTNDKDNRHLPKKKWFKKNRKKKQKKHNHRLIHDTSRWKGPLGRHVMTEKRYAEDPILQGELKMGDLRGANPKNDLFNLARYKWDCDIRIHHEMVNGEPPMFLATMTSSFSYPQDLERYKTDHDHIRHRVIVDNTSDAEPASFPSSSSSSSSEPVTQLICVGAAPTKKKAETLAAADTRKLLYEMGFIDIVHDPPDFRQERLQVREEKIAAAYKADLSRAKMLLEVIGSSSPRFETTDIGDNQWVASATCLYRGRSVDAIGEPARRKVEAQGRALIALSQSDDLAWIVGSRQMEIYRTIIEKAPGQHIASLQVPPMDDDLMLSVEACIGTASDYEARVRKHRAGKRKYERKLAERIRNGTSNARGRNNYPPLRSDKDILHANQSFQREEERRYQKAINDPNGTEGTMHSLRGALPIKNIQRQLVEALKTQQVVVVSGGTGSGKSTQCPQYILEDAILNGKGADTRIIVTQPRKIAAISVSERVAAERCERIGESVGYAVRFKRQSPRDHGGSIEFVTTGILLRRLMSDKTLSGISHVMIDEVHERDINTDFLIVLLRDLLKERPDLRVVLMSATLDAESFADYFSSDSEASQVPLLSVPSQPRHPVEVIYLEDLMGSSEVGADTKELAKSLLKHNDIKLRIQLEEALEEEAAANALLSRSRDEDEGEALGYDSGSDSDGDSDTTDLHFDLASNGDTSENVTRNPVTRTANARVKALKRAVSIRENDNGKSVVVPRGSKTNRGDKFDSRSVIVELVTKIARQLSREELEAGRSGSILCFLPGWDEIKLAMQAMEESPTGLWERMTVLPLHSTIPQNDQQKVFEPANGKVKVILATNIAESSVTIDDVLAVVDSGLVRELNFDAESAMSVMETNKTSKASATQRTGRAGRVAPGKCYRLYSRGDFEAMDPRPTPEIKRKPLEATCLQTCSMTSMGVENFLQRALDPPVADSVSAAMDRLAKLGALERHADGLESLTPLGQFLAGLPLDPATGRMLIMGVVMKCLDPLLTSAACFSSPNIFYTPPGLRDAAQEIRKKFSETSDFIAAIEAYDEFWTIQQTKGWGAAREWAFGNYVSISAMTSMRAVRSQLLEELRRAGLVSGSDLRAHNRRNASLRHDADVNRNSYNEALYGAVWASAFPDNLASRRPGGNQRTLRTRLDNHTGLHPSSVAFARRPSNGYRRDGPSWYVYREMVQSSQVFLRSVSALGPEQVLLFGGYALRPVEGDVSHARAVLDDWIVVGGPCSASIDLLARSRDDINLALEHKVMHPRMPLPKETEEILDMIGDVVLDPDGRDAIDSE